MEQFEEEFDGILIPDEKRHALMQADEKLILGELMFMTDCYRLESRAAMTEFLKRIFLCIEFPLNAHVDHYFSDGYLFSLATPKGNFDVSLSILIEWIGAKRKTHLHFEFINSINDFVDETIVYRPQSFHLPLRKGLHSISQEKLRNTETVALFFTDMIDEDHFKKAMVTKPNQYMREAIDALCFDKNKAVLFYPLNELSATTLSKIEQKIGSGKLSNSDDFVESTKNEKLEEIIRLAFGIKNGYINPRGSLFNFSESVDPYFFFSLTPVMNVFLESKTFMDLYHYYSMCEWMEILPQE